VVTDAKLARRSSSGRAPAKAAGELWALARVERGAVNVAQAGVRVARAWVSGDVTPLIECDRCEETLALR
jgi:hypothetical protein